MNEVEYIIATNRVKISMALTILRDVLPGEEYGISTKEYAKFARPLRESEVKLFSLYEADED